jgi:DNA-binding MurR/RpiR family transcriptional regulator
MAPRQYSKARREPSSKLSIQDLLRNPRKPFSKKQQLLVNFLGRNYQKVAFMNVPELSKETQVSQATIVRLAAMLGFRGYPEFQKAVQRIVSQDLTTVERLRLSVDAHEFDHPFQRTLKMDMRNLLRLYQYLSAQEVQQIADRILRARHVVVAGFMSSAPLAQYFGYSLQRLLPHVALFTDATTAARRAVFDLTRADLLIAFCFPRYPESLVGLLKAASAGGIPSMLFTDTGASPVALLADYPISVPFELLSFVDSLAAPISMLAAIIAEIVRRAPEKTADKLKAFEKMAARFGLFHRE